MAAAGAAAMDEICVGKGFYCSRWLQPDSKILSEYSQCVSFKDAAFVLLGAGYYFEQTFPVLLTCMSTVKDTSVRYLPCAADSAYVAM